MTSEGDQREGEREVGERNRRGIKRNMQWSKKDKQNDNNKTNISIHGIEPFLTNLLSFDDLA